MNLENIDRVEEVIANIRRHEQMRAKLQAFKESNRKVKVIIKQSNNEADDLIISVDPRTKSSNALDDLVDVRMNILDMIIDEYKGELKDA